MSGRGKIRPTTVRRAASGPADNAIGPRSFDPFRTDIHDCHCQLCRNVSYANRPPDETRAAGHALLAALRAGTHIRVEWQAYIDQAKRDHADRVAEACAAGVSEFRMFNLHRGYSGGSNERVFYGSPSADFECGIGLSMSLGRQHDSAVAARAARHARQDAERVARVPALIAADPRNACTAYRVTGEMCAHHVALVAPGDRVTALVHPGTEVHAGTVTGWVGDETAGRVWVTWDHDGTSQDIHREWLTVAAPDATDADAAYASPWATV